jgi:hypothetical protein
MSFLKSNRSGLWLTGIFPGQFFDQVDVDHNGQISLAELKVRKYNPVSS